MQTHFPLLTICKTSKNLFLNSSLGEEKCKPKHSGATDLGGRPRCAGTPCISVWSQRRILTVEQAQN